MTPTPDALANLRDIHLPDPVAAWPLAPGWWVIAAVAVCAILGLVLWRRARRRSLRHAALAELDRIAHVYRGQRDLTGLAYALSALLRRVALARFPREQVAALHGKHWLEFLESKGGGDFPRDVGEALESALYQQPELSAANGEREAHEALRWLAAVRHWIGATT